MLEAVGAHPAPLAARQADFCARGALQQVDRRANAPVSDRVTKLADRLQRAEPWAQKFQLAAERRGCFKSAGQGSARQFPEPRQQISGGAAPEQDFTAAAHGGERPGHIDELYPRPRRALMKCFL